MAQAGDRQTFEALLARADILLHGYRPGALDRLGYDPAARRAIAPALIDVSLCAYGWSGPWATRRFTSWGDAQRLLPPATVAGAPMQWQLPALKLGSAQPAWQ